MTALLRSIRPSRYYIRQLRGRERCNVHCDGLKDLILQRIVTRCPPETVRAFPFWAHLPSAIPTKCKLLPYLVHMIVICLTQFFFVSNASRQLVNPSRRRAELAPIADRVYHILLWRLVVCGPPKARPSSV
jgi:hypothetical protein